MGCRAEKLQNLATWQLRRWRAGYVEAFLDEVNRLARDGRLGKTHFPDREAGLPGQVQNCWNLAERKPVKHNGCAWAFLCQKAELNVRH